MSGEGIKKMWPINTVEYYTAVKKTGIMNFAGKQVELEKIISNEVTQTQRDKYHMFSLTEGSQLQTFRCEFM